MQTEAALDLIQDPGRATAILHPLRLRLLDELREPNSASGLSEHFNLPRQKLNYHLRELEKKGFLELVEERRKGNCTERILRATARAYLVDPATLGPLAADPSEIKDRFSSAYLVAVAARIIRDLGVLRSRASSAGKRLSTLTLQTEVRFGSAADQAAFAEELSNQVARLAAKYHNEGASDGRRFQVILGSYPTITKDAEETGDSKEKS